MDTAVIRVVPWTVTSATEQAWEGHVGQFHLGRLLVALDIRVMGQVSVRVGVRVMASVAMRTIAMGVSVSWIFRQELRARGMRSVL